MLWAYWISAGSFAIGACLPFFLSLSPPLIHGVIFWLGLGLIFQSIGQCFWWSLLHGFVPEDKRGHFFSRLRTLWSLSIFSAFFLGSLYLGKEAPPWKFQVIILITLVLYCLRNLIFLGIPMVLKEEDVTKWKTDSRRWKTLVRDFWNETSIKRFCTYYGFYTVLASFFFQPLILYMNHLGFPVRDNVMVFGFGILGMAFTLLWVGKLIDLHGPRHVFWYGHLAMCLLGLAITSVGIWGGSWTLPLMIFSFALHGGVLGATDLAFTAHLFRIVPTDRNAFYFSISAVVSSLARGLPPLLMGGLFVLSSPQQKWFSLNGREITVYEGTFVGISLLLAAWLFYFKRGTRTS